MTDRLKRAEIQAELFHRTQIDEPMIETLVRTFYGHVRNDDVLGSIFEARIEDWEPHLQRMCAFWSSVVLMSGRYHGRPMEKHLPLPIDARHFDHWLQLFTKTADTVCPPAAAAHFVDRARRIASSLELAMASDRGVLLPKGERLSRPDDEVFWPEPTSREDGKSQMVNH